MQERGGVALIVFIDIEISQQRNSNNLLGEI